MSDFLATAPAADPAASREFFRDLFGHYPQTPEEKAAGLAEARAANRAALEAARAEMWERANKLRAALRHDR